MALRARGSASTSTRPPTGCGSSATPAEPAPRSAPGGATIADGTLNYPPAAHRPRASPAAAYTNNDLDPRTATSLFDLDTTLDQVALQSPANSGSARGTGKLGVDAGPDAGFDIVSQVDGGTTTRNTAFATITTSGRAAFYKVQLLTGQVTRVGSFPRSHHVRDIALPIDK